MPLKSKPYEPIPIYDFESGLNLQREPWLLPAKAFQELFNFRVRQGVISKRMGIKKFSEVVHWYIESIGTGDGNTTNFTATLSNTPIRSESDKSYFQITDGTQVVHDEDEDGSLSGDGTGTINYTTGAVDVTFNSAPAIDVDIRVKYNQIPGNAVMGIWNYYSGVGDRQLCIFDTKRMDVYYPVQGQTQDVPQSDIWTGDNTKHFQMEVWEGNGYIVNGTDPIYVYDGSTLSELSTDVNDDSTNDIDTAHLVFAYKDRLVALRVTENGTLQPQRARWSAVGDATEWYDGGGYVDAPTLDWIVAAGFLGDRLFVMFERSIWALDYIGDVDLPFVWKKVIATEGCAAPMSLVPFANELLFLGFVRFISCDGVTTEHLSREIPDYSLRFEQDAYDLVYSAVLEEEHEVFWLYPSFGSSQLDRTLTLNYRNQSWSMLDIGGPSIGYYRELVDYTWDQIDMSWDEIEWRWDSKEAQSGYPTTLLGHYDGTIHTINKTGSDNGATIRCYLKTKAINPYAKENQAVRLGSVDIYYTIDSSSVITVRLYEWNNSSPYYQADITLDGPSRQEKNFKRLPVNAIAPFHVLEIEQDAASQSVDLHAFVFWMKPASTLAEVF